MKPMVLPYGQHALQGQTVNFPVNTSKICSSLPGFILIAPARTGSSDSTETPVAQIFLFCASSLRSQSTSLVETS